MTDLMLFGLGASRPFAEQVALQLGVALSEHEEREFEDGEHKARALVSVRGRDVFVVHSLYGDPRQSGNDKLCRLLFFIGALNDAAAARVTAVVPYLAYGRKDRKSKARDPVATRYVAQLFEAVGTDALVTLDVHNLAAFQNAFRCGAEHLEAGALFAAHLAPLLGDEEAVVVSPDAGGIKRADLFRQHLARRLGRPVGMAFVEKYRSEGVLSGGMLVGDVGGKTALIVDDLVSTGTTLARAASACGERGAAATIAAASHGLFMGAAPAVLAATSLRRIVVTDSVPPFRLEQASEARARLDVVSCSGLFATAIHCIHTGASISESIAS